KALTAGMRVNLESVSKKFRRDWIFRNLSYEFIEGESYAVLGPNGSGKSTLLQLIAGNISPTEGEIKYLHKGQNIPVEEVYRCIGMSAPYLQLIEELTLTEHLYFHAKFKSFINNSCPAEIIEILGMEKHKVKYIRNFSSGMKQRVKLALSILTDAPLVLLDEPLTNLDHEGKQWYLEIIEKYLQNRSLIICSNRQDEYDFCNHRINLGG
ncbi:MAG TPA: ABC transporter ATP-binding protein, partial [Flavobacterium sp.]|nr:ABC transporter ATP-binding protein [Flavobacterium sp.]